MTQAEVGPRRRRSRRFGFARGAIGGFVAGVTLATAMSVIAQDVDERDMVKKILFAIADLAVDTEANAKRIVDLEHRLDDLEVLLEETMPSGQ